MKISFVQFSVSNAVKRNLTNFNLTCFAGVNEVLVINILELRG